MIQISSFTFNPFQENTYVLYDETKECIIIDPGCYTPLEQADLSTFIENTGLKPVRLILTHCHIDHILGCKYVSGRYNLVSETNKMEMQVFDNAERAAAIFGIRLEKPPAPEKFIDEKDIIKFGNSSLQILFTPGHSPGSLCFYNKEQKFVIGGDVLFQGSIGRTDLPGGNFDTLISSIKEKLFQLGDDVTVYPGHGPETTVGFEKENNPFL
ncbi:MAG: Hydroxyacylglutathione hydrolase GloC [Bacteroidia bacterium]|nr:Hydroxyacylglutathione hydrolase GloC [Bacteroidia bacterium]